MVADAKPCSGKRNTVARLAVLVLGLAGLSGCGSKSSSDDMALAKVNDEVITSSDVDFALQRSFDRSLLDSVDADIQQKVLDSLIASHAMKQLALKDLSGDQLAHIKRQAAAYEEELLVKEYLQKHVTPEPITEAMVQDYYNKHPEEFAAETLRDFELLKAPANMDEKQRDQLLKKIGAIRATSNWSAAVAGWRQEFGLQFQQGRSKAGLLDKILEQKIAGLKQDETSDAFYVAGELHLVRVVKLTLSAPKALAEVNGDIRKRLAPMMLRDAVKKASDEARGKADVKLLVKK